MNRHNHVIMGGIFALSALIFIGVDLQYTPLALMALLGSILPDMDCSYGKHRKTFHNVFVMAGCWFYMWHFLEIHPIGNAFFLLGFASHLVADALTKRGVTIFYPISKFKVKGPITTGSRGEHIAMFLIMAAFIGVLAITFNIIDVGALL